MTPPTNLAGIVCPFCGSSDLDFPLEVCEAGSQAGPAYCYGCHAYQNADHEWVRPEAAPVDGA